MASNLDIQCERTFHGQSYQISIKAGGQSLVIQLDQSFECVFWKNTFTQAYIEDLTQKTGNKRKFEDFCMILTQAAQEDKNKNLNLDILTYQDLEAMKAKKSGLPPPTQQQLNPVQVKANKRYIILSVSVNGSNDKVHYPLTLNSEENEDVDKLRQTVRRLKMELDDVKSSRDSLSHSLSQSGKGESFFITENMMDKKMNSTNSSMQSHASEHVLQENELLKTKIKRLEESFSQKRGALDVDQIVREKVDLEIELDSIKIKSNRQINFLQSTVEKSEQELQRKRHELLELKKEVSQSFSLDDESSRRMKEHILKLTEESERELTTSRKTIHHLQKENEKCFTDVDFFKRNDQKQKNRIRQLEIELETAMKRGSARGVSDRLYSPYNKNGTASGGASGARRANSVPTKSYSPANRFNQQNKAQVSKPGGYQRNGSNDSQNANKSRLSPSYNYGYKKTQPATQSASVRNNLNNSNSNNNNRGGTFNQNVRNTNNSPGYNRVGINNNTTSANSRVSPGNNRFSPGQNQNNVNRLNNNNRVSPGQNSNQNRVSPQNRVPGTTATNNTSNSRISPANRLNNNNNRVSPGANNNRVSPGANNNRVSPGNRTGGYAQPLQKNVSNNNNTQNRGSTYGQGQGGVKNQSPGNRYNNQSPGTRYNNYMAGKKNPQQSGPINAKQVPIEFNDKHLKGQQAAVPNQNKDLDSRLDRLQNLLSKAKK